MARASITTPVLIVGGGPVGLTLAIDLARRGIPNVLVERRVEVGQFPKMERVNPRTMEHFRRLGLAERVRAAGLPQDLPMNVYVTDSLFADPLVTFPQAPVAELKTRTAQTNDGSMPVEPYQVISQYTLEPLLREEIERLDAVTTMFGSELLSFEQDDGEVRAVIRDEAGAELDVTASYLVGADGASSTVRKALGIRLVGEPRLLDLHQGLIRSDELYQQLPHKGRHYHFLDGHSSFLIVQDSTRHFTLHTMIDAPEQMGERFEAIVGRPVEYEVLFSAPWTMRGMVADSYGDGRVWLAGDSAHLMPPTAGLGMNTGVGEAIDLAWKLQSVLEGWGGPELLPSYDPERRPVARANVDYSLTRFRAREGWRAEVDTATVHEPAVRERLAELIDRSEAKAGYMEGVEIGYRYTNSPVIPGSEPDERDVRTGVDRRYRVDVRPGLRLPHVWLEPDVTAVQDILPLDAYSLLCLGDAGDVVAAFQSAFAALGAPLNLAMLRSESARTVYGARHVLVRPDLHIVWRGDELDADASSIAAVATGFGTGALADLSSTETASRLTSSRG